MKIRIIKSGLVLTYGEIYDAKIISYDPGYNNTIIEMVNDNGKLIQYFFPSSYFIDVTHEYRNIIIDGILK